ncbi:hypothetical protein JQN58_17900 [Aneurinibacillus sp. BA2021]|nr:hypothetical protein [Aneurinibacillus sp. BA2021]
MPKHVHANVQDVDLKFIMFRVPGDTPADVVQALKEKKRTSENFSAEILRLLSVAVRMEKDPHTVTFPMPQELSKDVLQWVKEEENKKMLGRFVYAALTGLQGGMPQVLTIEEPNEEEKAATAAIQNAAAMFLQDDDE